MPGRECRLNPWVASTLKTGCERRPQMKKSQVLNCGVKESNYPPGSLRWWEKNYTAVSIVFSGSQAEAETTKREGGLVVKNKIKET